MVISVKAALLSEFNRGETVDVRRFEIELGCTRMGLDSLLRAAFPSLRNGEFSVGWLDAEGDVVSMSGDEEMRLAMNECSDDRLKLYIWRGERAHGGTSTGSNTPHRGVCCDVCQRTPHGLRYKCLTCDDFDLCHSCSCRGLHSEHLMLRIGSPDHNWRPLFRRGNALFNRGQRPGRFGYHTTRAFCDAEDEMVSSDSTSNKQRDNSEHEGSKDSPRGVLSPRSVFKAVHSAMASLGNGVVPEHVTKSQDWTECGLREIGQSISSVLGSFGIAADVDVERRNTGNTCKSREQERTDQQETTASAGPSTFQHECDTAVLVEEEVTAASLMDQHRETRAPIPLPVEGNEQTAASTPTPSGSSEGGDGVTGWTMLDNNGGDTPDTQSSEAGANEDITVPKIPCTVGITAETTTTNIPCTVGMATDTTATNTPGTVGSSMENSATNTPGTVGSSMENSATNTPGTVGSSMENSATNTPGAVGSSMENSATNTPGTVGSSMENSATNTPGTVGSSMENSATNTPGLVGSSVENSATNTVGMETYVNNTGGVHPSLEIGAANTPGGELGAATYSGRFFHRDVNVQNAFEKLIAMGFVMNGKVTRIILEERGDISAVLDRMFR